MYLYESISFVCSEMAALWQIDYLDIWYFMRYRNLNKSYPLGLPMWNGNHLQLLFQSVSIWEGKHK